MEGWAWCPPAHGGATPSQGGRHGGSGHKVRGFGGACARMEPQGQITALQVREISSPQAACG